MAKSPRKASRKASRKGARNANQKPRVHAVAKKLSRDAYVDALADGRKTRSATFKSPDDYRRKPKHGNHWDD